MYSASEKSAIIRLVEDSELSIRRTLLRSTSAAAVFTAGTGLMNAMALMGFRTKTGHRANTGTRDPTPYGNWLWMWPWISRS